MLDDDIMDLPLVKFTAQDRCDRCGAQAYTMAKREDAAAELLFCMHHRREFKNALFNDGWLIIDDYEALERFADAEDIKV